jgi:hypothetical protein
MKEYIITLSDEEDKALAYVCEDQQAWLNNLAHNRCRKAIEEVCKKALGEDDTECELSPQDKAEIVQDMVNTGSMFVSPKQLPQQIKSKILQRARVETGKERNKRLEKELK